jgi:hypothetical protein
MVLNGAMEQEELALMSVDGLQTGYDPANGYPADGTMPEFIFSDDDDYEDEDDGFDDEDDYDDEDEEEDDYDEDELDEEEEDDYDADEDDDYDDEDDD